MWSPPSFRHSTKGSAPHQHLLSAIFTDLLPSKLFQNSQTGTCWGSATGSSGKNKVNEIYFHIIPICLSQMFSRVLLLQKIHVRALFVYQFCSHQQMWMGYFQTIFLKNYANAFSVCKSLLLFRKGAGGSGFTHRCLSSVLSILFINCCFIYSDTHHRKLFFLYPKIYWGKLSELHIFKSSSSCAKAFNVMKYWMLIGEEKKPPLYWYEATEKRNSLKTNKIGFVIFIVLKHKKMGMCGHSAHGVRTREIASS